MKLKNGEEKPYKNIEDYKKLQTEFEHFSLKILSGK